MMMKMATSCKVLNDILRNPEKYDGLKNIRNLKKTIKRIRCMTCTNYARNFQKNSDLIRLIFSV